MSTLTLPDSVVPLPSDPVLAHAIAQAVKESLTMCQAETRLVGLSAVPVYEPGSVTAVVGLHGKVSGFLTFNTCEQVALNLAVGFLQEPMEKLNGQVIDCVGEIANLIAGGVKKRLSTTEWAFNSVTVPSVIIGHNYQIAYAKGIQYLAVTFEHHNTDALLLEHRLLQVAVSLVRL